MEKEELERLVETEQRSKSNTKRLDKLELKVDDIHNLALSVQAIATEMKAMREDMTNIDNRVLAIEAKPSKKTRFYLGICSVGFSGWCYSIYICKIRNEVGGDLDGIKYINKFGNNFSYMAFRIYF